MVKNVLFNILQTYINIITLLGTLLTKLYIYFSVLAKPFQ